MTNRITVMYMEIGCFVSCLSGWILVCSTLPTDYWSISDSSESVLTIPDFYNNLWKNCIADGTGSSNCKDYPSMMALPGFLQACRALAVSAVILGFFGGVLTLIGMKCTKIGGSQVANARVTFSGAITYMVSGFSGMSSYSMWASKTVSEFMNTDFRGQKYELGAALFVGWGGSILLILGGVVLGFLSGKESIPSSNSPKRPLRPASRATARTRRTYMLPASLSRVTLGGASFHEGRQSRATTKTVQTLGRDSFV
ncbi:claudin-10 [Mastacembelus armatus]|nr:claudin-10-like [Mastacembelus armatus]